ncbi:MAG: hypothetical protein QG641_510 [Candidatus Poribacteria bacterium]|nr:hypothetical protein [Candidatus Poribacteria bacterium]
MLLQRIGTKGFVIQAIIAFMQGNTRVVYFTSKRDLVMKIPILFGIVDFEAIVFHWFL